MLGCVQTSRVTPPNQPNSCKLNYLIYIRHLACNAPIQDEHGVLTLSFIDLIDDGTLFRFLALSNFCCNSWASRDPAFWELSRLPLPSQGP